MRTWTSSGAAFFRLKHFDGTYHAFAIFPPAMFFGRVSASPPVSIRFDTPVKLPLSAAGTKRVGVVGDRFLLLREMPTDEQPLHLVQHWTRSLERGAEIASRRSEKRVWSLRRRLFDSLADIWMMSPARSVTGID